MKVEILWIVSKPEPASVLADICYPATLREFALIAVGANDANSFVAAYTEEAEAVRHADKLLAARVTCQACGYVAASLKDLGVHLVAEQMEDLRR